MNRTIEELTQEQLMYLYEVAVEREQEVVDLKDYFRLTNKLKEIKRELIARHMEAMESQGEAA